MFVLFTFAALALLFSSSLAKATITVFARPVIATAQQPVAATVDVPESTLVNIDPLAEEVQHFLRRVHRKESSNGTNTNPAALHNICEAKGESNEYGYGGMALMLCFPSHEKATAEVKRWYQEHRPQMDSEAMTYCYYALGRRLPTCAYWQEVKDW
jgi:hypothetical protein